MGVAGLAGEGGQLSVFFLVSSFKPKRIQILKINSQDRRTKLHALKRAKTAQALRKETRSWGDSNTIVDGRMCTKMWTHLVARFEDGAFLFDQNLLWVNRQ